MCGDQVPQDRIASRETVTLVQHAEIPAEHAFANHTHVIYTGTSAEEVQVQGSNP